VKGELTGLEPDVADLMIMLPVDGGRLPRQSGPGIDLLAGTCGPASFEYVVGDGSLTDVGLLDVAVC
jgi:hypothetical protein